MRFIDGQKVVCILEKSEWDLVVPDFNETLKIALAVKTVPTKGDVCTVASNLEIHYKGKTYIRVKEYPAYIFAEDGFTPFEASKTPMVLYNDFTAKRKKCN